MLGFDPGERPRALRERVGIVLQSSGIYSQVRVREAVAHFAGFYPHPRDVDEVIELVGLEGKEDALARTLSGGQRRRLDLALALIGDPELIFLDEPTTGFDPAARRTAWETIRSLKDLGKTVLLTTHYLDEAQELADRVAIIKGGRILAEGPPRSSASAALALPRRLRPRRRPGRARDRRPDGAAARADRRGAGARRAARVAVRHAAEPRGRLPGADRGRGAQPMLTR